MPNLSLTISFHPTAKHADVSIDSETLVKDAVELFKLLDRHESTERGLYLPRTAPQCSAGALDLYLDPSRTLASYRLVDKVRCAIVVVAAITIRLTPPTPPHLQQELLFKHVPVPIAIMCTKVFYIDPTSKVCAHAPPLLAVVHPHLSIHPAISSRLVSMSSACSPSRTRSSKISRARDERDIFSLSLLLLWASAVGRSSNGRQHEQLVVLSIARATANPSVSRHQVLAYLSLASPSLSLSRLISVEIAALSIPLCLIVVSFWCGGGWRWLT